MKMIIHPRYSHHVALIAVCYFLQPTKCMPMGDMIDLEHTARNPVENFTTSTSETARYDTREPHNLNAPGDVSDHMLQKSESKETAEDFIVNSLDPLKNYGMSRNRGEVEIPQAKDLGVTINLMNQEFDSLKINLKEAKAKLSKTQFEKIEEMYQSISFLMKTRQDELEGQTLHMRIPRILQPDKTLYAKLFDLISFLPFDYIYQNESEEGPIIQGNLFGQVMKKMGKNIAEGLVGLLLEDKPVQEHPVIFEYLPSHNLSLQALRFMYRNHLITMEDFQSLFQPKAVYNTSKNMLGSFLPNNPEFRQLFPLDSSSILNSWGSSDSREIYNALGKEQQRMFHFGSIKSLFENYFKYPKKFHIESMENEMQELWDLFFKNDQLFNVLEKYPQSAENPIILHLQKLFNTFESIEGWHQDDEGQFELTLFFQIFQFVEENYPHMMTLLTQKNKEFWRKYSLMHESTQFYGRLGNLKLYLLNYFHGRNLWPSSEHLNEKTRRLITPLDELEYISNHLDKITSKHSEIINNIQKGDELKEYHHEDTIEETISSLKTEIADLKVKYASGNIPFGDD
ncbi:hypothetical protein PGTUg99_024687 [Puccinia graminis f. sp. tritici]|nr:hypothetical protein PGTUg99_024687 [Puccinia graminis f. sp. tritici]